MTTKDEQRIIELEAALKEALEGWSYCANYKGAYFVKKHGDIEDIERLQKLIGLDKDPETNLADYMRKYITNG